MASLDKVKKCINAGLDSIKFSINAGSKETYKIVHGYDDWEKVIRNVNNIYKYKVQNKLDLQLLCSFVYTDVTIDEIDNFKNKFSKFFEDMFFSKAGNQAGRTYKRSKTITQKINQNCNITENSEEKKFKPCDMIWDKIHFTAEGYLTACCVDYENDLVYSKYNVNENIFDQFNNKKIKGLRKKHLKNKLDGTMCKNCLYNTSDSFESLSNYKFEKSNFNKKKINSLNSRLKKYN